MKRFEDAMVMLTAMDLVVLYQLPDAYLVKLQQPLGHEAFLKEPVYSRLLEQKIGESAVSELQLAIPNKARNISKRFSDVFGTDGLSPKTSQSARKTFDLDSFQQLMTRDGLQFEDSQKDVISLYSISEQYEMNWFDTYQLAKATAVNGKIQPKRLLVKKQQAAKEPSNDTFLKQSRSFYGRPSKTVRLFSWRRLKKRDEQQLLKMKNLVADFG